MRTRFTAAVLAALLSLASVLVVPWARYGDIDIPLHRLPAWGAHLATVPVLYAAVAWALLAPAARRAVPLTAAVVACAAVVVTAVLVALGYDDPSALFTGPVPAVHPGLGPGPFLAVLAALAGLGAAALPAAGERGRARHR